VLLYTHTQVNEAFHSYLIQIICSWSHRHSVAVFVVVVVVVVVLYLFISLFIYFFAQGKLLEALQCMEKSLILRGHIFGLESVEVYRACKSVGEMCNYLAMTFLQQGKISHTHTYTHIHIHNTHTTAVE